MRKKTQRAKYIAVDFVSASLFWLLFNVVRFHEIAHYYGFHELSYYVTSLQVIKGQLFVPFFMLVLYFFSGYYNRPLEKSRLDEFLTTLFSSILATLFLFFVIVLDDLPPSERIYYRLFASLLMLSFVVTYIFRLVITQRAAKKIRNREWTVKVLVVGNGEKARFLTGLLEKPIDAVSYTIEGYVEPGDTDKLSELIAEKQTSELIVAIDDESENVLLTVLYSLYKYNQPIKIPLSTHKILTGRMRTKSIAGIPLVDLSSGNMSESAKNIKWAIDKLGALTFLILFSPLYVLLAIWIRLASSGSVIFSQERIGYLGKPFKIYKFRTMVEEAEKDGPSLSSTNDPRVTKTGRFLRKYRLDELPQFWNVLKGDMSLVGPRPERRCFIEQIEQKAPWFYLLHNVYPGVTSWGMVKYGYATNVDEMIERLEYDIIYYENMSLFVDMKILIYTIRTIVLGRGV